ncbi:MAG: histidinol phosphate phosphatase [Alphaproteobacteria bacterium]|nr:histidinol phosphate phosphatase [Alphaproteobacteria bacterium]
MPLVFEIPDEFPALAARLADAAGAVIRPYFRALPGIDFKSDSSPVTLADREAESAMRDILRTARPGDGVWGEEHGAENMDAEWVWTLDPVDGTRAFTAGKPLFGTLIGLMHQAAPVYGVLDQPIMNERWEGGIGRPAQLNGKPARARACASLGHAYLNTTTPDMFSPGEWRAFKALSAKTRDTLYGGDCYAYGLLASGHIDLVAEADLKLHDYAALAPIVDAAGGIMTDWQGRALNRDSAVSGSACVLASGDRALHAGAVELLHAAERDTAR